MSSDLVNVVVLLGAAVVMVLLVFHTSPLVFHAAPAVGPPGAPP